MTPEEMALDGGVYIGEPPLNLQNEARLARESQADGIALASLENVKLRDPEWLVRGFVPAGELTLLVGHGGVSKGTYAAQLAATVSRGEGEAQKGEPAHVLWAAAEDSLASVLVPRLLAAGADISLVNTVEFRRDGIEDAICLPDDVPALQETVIVVQAKLLIIDPLLSHLSGKVDSYRDHDVKRSLRPLAQMATETGCAVVGVHHLGKDTTRGSLLSAQASGAFSNTARVVLALAEHDEDDLLRVLEVVKTNISRKGLRKALRVELVQVPGLTEPVPRTGEAGEADKSVDELLGQRRPRGTKRDDAKQLILLELQDGPKSMDYLKAKVAAEIGASGDTTWRAANGLKADGVVACSNSGTGTPWLWKLVLTSASSSANPHGSMTSPHSPIAEVKDTPTHTTNTYLSDFVPDSDGQGSDFGSSRGVRSQNGAPPWA
jgi:hypothetical protein